MLILFKRRDTLKLSITKELFFSTPVYCVDIDEGASVNEMLKDRILSWREQDGQGVELSNVASVNAWQSKAIMLEMAEFDFFSSIVNTHMNELFQDQQYHENTEAQATNMWANINPKKAYNRGHTHPCSLWSGVYYVQTPENCGQITFLDPRPQTQIFVASVAEGAHGNEHFPIVSFEPIAGRLILFPSWLHHEVEPNLSDLPSPHGERISISFNYCQQDKTTN